MRLVTPFFGFGCLPLLAGQICLLVVFFRQCSIGEIEYKAGADILQERPGELMGLEVV